MLVLWGRIVMYIICGVCNLCGEGWLIKYCYSVARIYFCKPFWWYLVSYILCGHIEIKDSFNFQKNKIKLILFIYYRKIWSLNLSNCWLLFCFAVIAFSDAPSALNFVREKKGCNIDVILTEVHMANMDGYEFLKHATKEINVPIISK